MATLETVQGAVLFRVRVQPRASRDTIRFGPEERVRITLTAPPVDGKANDALCRFVAKTLGIRTGNVTVAGGARGRDKVLRLEEVSEAEIRRKLAPFEQSR